MRSKRVLSAIAVATIAGLVVTACSGSGDDSGAENKGITVGLGEPKFLIPGNTTESEGSSVLTQVYQGLYDYSPTDGSLVPVIAAGAPETKDNKVFTIKLKDGFTFDNGEKVDAASFIRGWNMTALGDNGYGGNYFFTRFAGYEDMNPQDPDGPDGEQKAPPAKVKELSGLKAVDPLTIEITLASPWVGLPTMLGYTVFYPIAEACAANVDACNEKPIGNGRFKMEGAWEHNTQIKVVKSDTWAGEKPAIESITFKEYVENAICWDDFRAGTIDICSPPSAQYQSAKAEYGDKMYEVASPSFSYVGFPNYVKPFDNPKVRQAFSLAIDRNALNTALYEGRYTPATSFTPPNIIPGGIEGTCGYCTFDVEKAKKLLEEAGGWEKGKKLQLWFNTNPENERWFKAFGDQIKANLGIDYEFQNLEWADYLQQRSDHKFTGPYRLGWLPDYPLNENYLTPIYGNGPANDMGYHSKAFEDKILEGDAAATQEEGIKLYQEAERILGEDMPVAPMFFSKSSTVIGERLDPASVTIHPILGGVILEQLKLL